MWDNLEIVKSSDENVKKLVFTQEGDNGAVAESVLYKYPTYQERTVICCSTQSGCPVGCRFCGTGEFFIRNLTADEIIEQVMACISIACDDPSITVNDMDNLQIMFMSMGEPMLNWKALKGALIELNEMYPKAKLLISTIAPKASEAVWEDFLLTSKLIPEIGLQFSVHEAIEEDRNALIPMTHKLSLEEIGIMGERWAKATGRRPFFNYCVHDKNDTDSHVDALYGYFNPAVWECTLSVICESDEGVAAANQRQRQLVEDFMQKILTKGYSTRMFDPAGQDDIGGGCGQLWYVQDWARNHPELTKKSHGTGKDKVHAPREETGLLNNSFSIFNDNDM